MPEVDIEAAARELAELVRKEALALLASGKNWKLVISANAGGDVRTTVELYSDTLRRFAPVVKASRK